MPKAKKAFDVGDEVKSVIVKHTRGPSTEEALGDWYTLQSSMKPRSPKAKSARRCKRVRLLPRLRLLSVLALLPLSLNLNLDRNLNITAKKATRER